MSGPLASRADRAPRFLRAAGAGSARRRPAWRERTPRPGTTHAIYASPDRILHRDGRNWKHHPRIRAHPHLPALHLHGHRPPGGGTGHPALRAPSCPGPVAHRGGAGAARRGEAARGAGRESLFRGIGRGRTGARAIVARLPRDARAHGDARALPFLHRGLSGDPHRPHRGRSRAAAGEAPAGRARRGHHLQPADARGLRLPAAGEPRAPPGGEARRGPSPAIRRSASRSWRASRSSCSICPSAGNISSVCS